MTQCRKQEKYPQLDFDLKDLTNFIQVNVKKKRNDPVNDPVNDRHRMIIALIKGNKYITRKQLSEECKVSVETIKRDIRKLRQLDFIKRIGPDKGGYWEVINKNEN